MSNASESICRCRKPEIGRLSHLFLFRLKTSKRLLSRSDQGEKSFNLSRQLFLRVAILSEPTSSSRHGASLLGPVDRRSAKPTDFSSSCSFLVSVVESEIWAERFHLTRWTGTSEWKEQIQLQCFSLRSAYSGCQLMLAIESTHGHSVSALNVLFSLPLENACAEIVSSAVQL
jgi:hypothetical protein